MAEFQEVMKEWERMCDYMHERGLCRQGECPLYRTGGIDACSAAYERRFVNEDYNEVSQIIMKWAAEHPVFYPTWYEYLSKIFDPEVTKHPNDAEAFFYAVNSTRLTAETAQKLGVKPREE